MFTDYIPVHNYKYRLTAIYARINDIQTTVEPTTYRQTLEIDKQLRQCMSKSRSRVLTLL
jgi:hypothetical protein